MEIELHPSALWPCNSGEQVQWIGSRVIDTLTHSIEQEGTDSPTKIVLTLGGPHPMVECRDEKWATIRVALGGWYPLQFCYQFAHEYGHVLANHWQIYRKHEFLWLEEAICGALSIVALRGAKHSWQSHELLKSSSMFMDDYIDNTQEYRHALPVVQIADWYRQNERALRSVHGLQDENRGFCLPIADALLEHPGGLASIRALPQSCQDECNLEDYLSQWIERCEQRRVTADLPQALARIFGTTAQ